MRTIPFTKKALFILAAFALALIVAKAESAAYRSAGSPLSLERLCCDGFFVSAVCFISVGLLTLIVNWGGFDTISYGFAKLGERFTRKPTAHRNYFDYTQAKQAQRKNKNSSGLAVNFIVSGAIMLLASIAVLLTGCF